MITSCTLSIVLSVFNGKPGMLSWSGLANFGTFKVNFRFLNQVGLSFLYFLGCRLQYLGSRVLFVNGNIRRLERRVVQLYQFQTDDISDTVSDFLI